MPLSVMLTDCRPLWKYATFIGNTSAIGQSCMFFGTFIAIIYAVLLQ